MLHDLHESVALLYDNTIGDGPYNAWLDPILTNEWQMLGWNNVNEMTRWGMPGVFAFGTFDTWSPGYLMFMAATHNGISRLYETYGNGGSADTQDRTLSANDTSRTWYRQNPAPPRVRWSLRNNNNYEMTGILLSENYFANNRVYFLRNFYEKSKRSILKAKTEGPGGVRAAGERSATRVAGRIAARAAEAGRRDFARDLGVHREPAGAAAGRQPAGGAVVAARTRRRGRRRGGWQPRRRGRREPRRAGAAGAASRRGPAAQAHAAQARSAGTGAAHRRRAGAARVPRRQLHRPHGSAVFAHRGRAARLSGTWAPNDPQKRPYDDTGWTFPEGFGVQAVRITDAKVLEAPMTLVNGPVKAARRHASAPARSSRSTTTPTTR